MKALQRQMQMYLLGPHPGSIPTRPVPHTRLRVPLLLKSGGQAHLKIARLDIHQVSGRVVAPIPSLQVPQS